ncbi:MAG: response regulator [Clostridiales bacterium]|jgi:DNA-binding NarL/FixJ family response regulator|nr:response regulator [Clostridiales bacterium]
MYNLLLVDDEESILDGLYKNVEWEDAEMTGVFRAADSESALRVMESNRIDVIVTDIRMPGLSGLEMSAVVRGRWPMTKIILLSGHREFDYARNALEIGVFAYHIKPVSYSGLLDSVRRAGQAIGEELRQVGVLLKAEERVRAASSLIAERLLTRWIVHGIPLSGEDLALAGSCGLRIAPEGSAFMAMFRLDEKDEDHGATVDYTTISLFLSDLIAGILADDWRPAVFSDRPGSFILLVAGEPEPLLGDMRRRFESAVDAIQESFRKTLGWLCTIIWGRVEPLSQAGKSYQELVKREKTQLLMEPGALIGPGNGRYAARASGKAAGDANAGLGGGMSAGAGANSGSGANAGADSGASTDANAGAGSGGSNNAASDAGSGGGLNIESLSGYPDMRILAQSGQR